MMGVWRPKQEESKTIWFRVPASLKKEFEDLRQQAEAEGLDAAATFTAALGRLAKQRAKNCPRRKLRKWRSLRKLKATALTMKPGRSGPMLLRSMGRWNCCGARRTGAA